MRGRQQNSRGRGLGPALSSAAGALGLSWTLAGALGCGVQPGGQTGTPTCPEGSECNTHSAAPETAAAESSAKDEGAKVAAESRPWRRGGPGSAGPLAVEGPSELPKPLWQVSLGAAITGKPIFARTADGSLAAFIGTHAGRFVGVAVAGAKAGTIVVDLNVPGIVWGTAAIAADGLLVVGADDDTLYGVDPVAGAVVWTSRVGACDPPRARGPEGTRCDPDGGPTVGVDGDLYVGADGVYRLEPKGAVRWHYPPAELGTRWHVAAAPLVTRDGDVFVGGQDGALIALDRDGELRWRVELGPDVDAAPVLLGSGLVVAAADDGRVVAIDQRGELRWTFTAGKDVRAPLAVGADDTIYAAALDGLLYALRPDGALRWSFAAGGPIASAPLVDSAGRIYFGARDDFVYAVDAEGRERWRIELPEDVDGGLAITEGGALVVGGDDGFLRAYR